MNTEQQSVTDTWLDGEPPCESAHDIPEIATCAVHVVARKYASCSGTNINICRVSYEFNASAMAAGLTCASCDRPASECYEIRLI